MKKPKRYPIALDLPRIVSVLIVYSRHVVQCMTNNTWLPDPPVTMADATKHIDDLASAQTQAKTRAKGTIEARDLAEKAVVDDMVAFKGYVGQIVAKNPADALLIIASAGMKPKQFRLHHKAPLSAAMSGVPQEVVLRAKARRGRAAYEWQASSDGGKSWAAAGISTEANIRVPGLTVGTMYLFRFRITVKATAGDWSDPVSLLIT